VLGANGEFQDACTDDGNLVEHSCEIVQVDPACEEQPNTFSTCPLQLSGNVLSQELDCDGGCVAGACEMGCPLEYQRIRVDSDDGAGVVQIRNLTDGRDYRCERFQRPDDANFDCNDVVGQAGYIATRLGQNDGVCTGGDIGGMGVCFDDEPECFTQHCSFVSCHPVY
jgi:hypothetical protein